MNFTLPIKTLISSPITWGLAAVAVVKKAVTPDDAGQVNGAGVVRGISFYEIGKLVIMAMALLMGFRLLKEIF